jgi:hypothetical protein
VASSGRGIADPIEATVTLQPRSRTTLAWALWLVTMAACVAGLVVALVVTRPLTAQVVLDGALYALGFPLGYATVGLVLTLRRPANPIGWLYAASALVWSALIPLGPWVEQLAREQRPLPLLAKLDAVAAVTLWAPAIALGITLPALLVPDGRLRSPRWRLVAVAAVAATAGQVVGNCLDPAPTTQTLEPLAKPLALHGWPGTVATVVSWTGFGVMFACVPAAALCAVLRFRASRGVERQQLRWVAFGAAASVVGPLLALGLAALGVLPSPDAFSWPLLLSVPLAIAVAVLRYRLWDLDRLISRTVAYALVTALLLIPYLLILPAAGRLAGGAGSLAVAAATLAAAAVFQPLRRRIQDLVDRRFNRRRYDAARTVDTFAARLREQIDLDALSAELLAVVDQTVAPTRASLWLRPSASSRLPP